jgi:signal peptidase I
VSSPQDSAASRASEDRPAEPAVGSDAGSPATGDSSGPAEFSSPPESSSPDDSPVLGDSSGQDGEPTSDGQGAAESSTSTAGEAASADGEAAPGDGEAAPGDGEAAPGAGTAARPGRRGRRRRKRSFLVEFPILVAIALLLAVVIKSFAIQAFWIPSGSMENTLEINDRVLVNKIIYHIRPIHRGDIVVFNGDGSWDPGTVPEPGNIFQQFASGFASMFGFGHPGDILIKRVIGIPGDHVACCDAQGRVTVNGVPLNEGSYLYPGSAPSLARFNIVVPPGRLWVMGDNRFYSDDSRDHMGDPGGGTIPESAVVGRAFVIIWPLSRWRILPIPATFEQPALNGSHAAASAADAATGADLVSARAEPTGQTVPLVLGFAGAIPLTWMQRRFRTRIGHRRRRRRTSADRSP